jgi:protein gp37
MSDHSAIEWTDSTWNPVTGCSKISPGCKHCYAETFAERFRGVLGHPYEQGFDMKLWPERLEMPLRWREPRMIFVNSMSDLFHEDVPDDYIARVFDVMIRAEHHVFQLLTKRSARLMDWSRKNYRFLNEKVNGKPTLPGHIWLGVSVENQKYTSRIKDLQRVPAVVRFLSIEPLLGPVQLTRTSLRGIHWVIVGGESGHKARPMEPTWASDVQRACRSAKVPFFFKQWGAHNAEGERVGKKAAGRLLRGRTWDELPVHLDAKRYVSDEK